MGPDDLLQEAVTRSLEENGGRNCPRNVKVATFLGNAMRSIASHARKKWAREIPVDVNKDDKDEPVIAMSDPALSPEEIVRRQHDCAKIVNGIEEMFDKDPKAEAVAIGIMAGWSQEEICEVEPMSGKEYAAARKRTLRALRREFSKGSIYE